MHRLEEGRIQFPAIHGYAFDQLDGVYSDLECGQIEGKPVVLRRDRQRAREAVLS